MAKFDAIVFDFERKGLAHTSQNLLHIKPFAQHLSEDSIILLPFIDKTRCERTIGITILVIFLSKHTGQQHRLKKRILIRPICTFL